MRARALHPDVIVVTSALLQVNCVLVQGAGAEASAATGDGGGGPLNGPLNVIEVPPGGAREGGPVGVGGSSEGSPGGSGGAGEDGQPAETFVIDSPVLPEELEMLPSVLAQAGFPAASGLLATHADWDHVLGPLAFPEVPLGIAESSAERLASEPGAAQRELRSFDEELYLQRARPLALGATQPLPVPGHLKIGVRELELHPTGGHTSDGMAIRVPWAGVLVAGDYLSEIEIPMLNPGGSDLDVYLATLERLRPLLVEVEHVVPGHGPVLSGDRAGEILVEDVAYLTALAERGAEAELPEGRRSREMRTVHLRNAEQLG